MPEQKVQYLSSHNRVETTRALEEQKVGKRRGPVQACMLLLEPGLPDPEEEDDLSFFLPLRFFFFFRGSSAGDADRSRLPRLLRLRASFLPVLAGLPAPSSTSIEVSTRLVATWRSRTLSVLPVILGGSGLAGLAGPAT